MSLVLNWIIILLAGALLAKYLKPFKSFYSGLMSMVIGVTVTYIISLFIPTSDLIWSLIAVSYASFCSGMFAARHTSLNN